MTYSTKFVLSLPYKLCKDTYKLKNSNIPNTQLLDQLIINYSIKDIATVNFDQYHIPARCHELIIFIVNSDNLIDIDDLDTKLLNLSKCVEKYFFVAINKFLLCTSYDRQIVDPSPDNFDLQIINHYRELSNFNLIMSTSRNDDTGSLGNFVFPVTQLLWAKS